MNEIKINPELQSKFDKVQEILANIPSCVIALSGGVDSTLLLKLAAEFCNGRVLAVSSKSAVSPSGEIEEGIKFAESLGIEYRTIDTNELEDPEFVANPPDRCYHCKSNLFMRLSEIAREEKMSCVLDGSNFDDRLDYRPGAKAVKEFKVRSPLKEAELTKDDIRILSKYYDLPTWDKPASPCLASRVPYNSIITAERLSRIDKAERILKEYGIRELRVRDHDQVARLEIPREHFHLIVDEENQSTIVDKFKELGYKYVALDLQGFRSGSLNEVLKE